ncbi:small-conductance mechanosensitive channel [Sporosarcina sp. ACRSL]|uniref:small-conductance mechanosensitive channel n=1 Tax=Sporosarcina sp. ACRSL TaxID=2918215 RepID=UPI001EF65D4B|nr:small-conductance mechanosensitive channel [Sporosarcina sp. ACRSL]MCG7344802.1 small-conductance mechanosensitive channel [Sporosarcina sp. ACRSL]
MSISPEYVRGASKAKSESASSSMARFHEQSHFWGRLTILLVMIASVGLPAYLSFVLGAHPGWGPILAGLIGYAAFIGVLWILEPITYFPILGIGGTYIAFLSGNIANLCVPCSSAAQKAVGAELGTKKAEIAGVLGIALASLTNTIIIILTVLTGTFIVNLIPESIQASFVFVLPAVFGAVLGQFAFSKPKYGVMAVLIGIGVFFSPIPSLIKIASCVAISIAIIYNVEKAKDKKANA